MNIYKIATIIIQNRNCIPENVWSKFLYDGDIEGIDITIKICDSAFSGYGILGYEIGKSQYCYQYEIGTMFVDISWKEIQILPLHSKEHLRILLLQIFYVHAVQQRMIQIHSSMIDYQGKGLLFLGPSGIGKTTMAELWSKYRDALIINGDMNFVQETDECFLGWGTPWHGSSPYCENTNVPVHALIVLKQASENSIRELKNFEKVQSVSNNIIYPIWLENGMELCLETLDHLLTALPVYELSCRPDEDAVRLTEEKIFGNL